MQPPPTRMCAAGGARGRDRAGAEAGIMRDVGDPLGLPLGDIDGDGDVDCADSDCVGDLACLEICNDGIDNDVDGAIDCADAALLPAVFRALEVEMGLSPSTLALLVLAL